MRRDLGREGPRELRPVTNWEERVKAALAEGVPVFQKNGLPLVAQRGHDGALLEHEHADHAGYMFPVRVVYTKEKPKDLPAWDPSYEDHAEALIFYDSHIALTLWECCYTLWSMRKKGGAIYGPSWSEEWALAPEVLEKLWPGSTKLLEGK
jgi:hypothetical protein